MRKAGLLCPLIAIAIFLFFFVTPPGQHLFFAATNWFGHIVGNVLIHSIPSPTPRTT